MKMIAPAGVTHHVGPDGVTYRPDTNGVIDISAQAPAAFMAAGFVPITQGITTTGGRPKVGLYAGMPAFDTTLGKPIWRNAANTGWVDATGAAA